MIHVEGRCIHEAGENGLLFLNRTYLEHDGLACRQYRELHKEDDYQSGTDYRESPDNGRTWGPWTTEPADSYSVMYGEDERIFWKVDEFWNPVHQHYVGTYFTRYFLEGHKNAYRAWWGKGEKSMFDHQWLRIRKPGRKEVCAEYQICYEEGAPFDAANPRNPEFLWKNQSRVWENGNIVMLEDGDIAFPMLIPVEVGCRRANVDVQRVFPSCPKLMACVMVARGHFDDEKLQYDFTFSNPVILGDLRSSRGIDEPALTKLKSGRLLLVMRGSNVIMPGLNMRIDKGTPSFKWYAWSDDGGRTFTEAEPWHFDDGEVIYSSATIGRFFRSRRNGKLYWIGNITSHTAYGSYPRYPLHIVEVNEQTGAAVKESLTVIDTRREGEPELVQLSNFRLVEDRETDILELTLCKVAQFDGKKPYWGETWQYDIDLGE